MNRVILLGRLCADPETKYTQNNTPMTRFKIAVNRQGKPKNGEPSADFFNITAWKQTAEFVGKYFRKGQQVLIEGYLRNNSWTDQQGNKRYSDEINATQVYFADSKQSRTTADEVLSTYQNPPMDEQDPNDELPF